MNIEPFLKDLSERGYSGQTIRAYRSDLAQFASFIGARDLRSSQVTEEVVGEYIEQMKGAPNNSSGDRNHGLAATTIERRLASLASYFAWLLMKDPRRRNPVSRFRDRRQLVRRVRHPQDKAAGEGELEVLMAGVENPRDKAILALFLTSGLRLTELAQLDISSIHRVEEKRPRGNARIYGTGTVLGKGAKERRFYFDDETVSLVEKYLASRNDESPALFLSQRGSRLSARAIEQMLTTWCRKLGIGHLHPHQLRHSYATRLANADIEALVLRDLMGHEDFRTTDGYFTMADETKARQYFAAMEVARPK